MNLNNLIKITLTEKGIQIYKKYWDKHNNGTGYYPGLTDNILLIQIWDFAYIFGQHLWNGNSEPPCKNNFELIN